MCHSNTQTPGTVASPSLEVGCFKPCCHWVWDHLGWNLQAWMALLFCHLLLLFSKTLLLAERPLRNSGDSIRQIRDSIQQICLQAGNRHPKWIGGGWASPLYKHRLLVNVGALNRNVSWPPLFLLSFSPIQLLPPTQEPSKWPQVAYNQNVPQLEWRMDLKNVVHLHNGILFKY